MKKIFRMAAFMLALGSMTAGFTSCGEDDEDGNVADGSIDEVVDCSGLKIKANADGTITIEGKVEANAKIKEFCLYAEDGKTVKYDFLESSEQVKEKNKVYDEDGKATKEKLFKLENLNTTVPVDLYVLSIKTKNVKKPVKEQLGEVLEYKIGARESKTGSYLSIVNNEAFALEDAKATKSCEVASLSSEDGKSVTGLKKGSKLLHPDAAANSKKVAFFVDGKSVDEIAIADAAKAVIITESGCICKINSLEQNADGDATIKAVTIKKGVNNSVAVSVDGFTFSK